MMPMEAALRTRIGELLAEGTVIARNRRIGIPDGEEMQRCTGWAAAALHVIEAAIDY